MAILADTIKKCLADFCKRISELEDTIINPPGNLPSTDECNALSLGADGRYFTEDPGYRIARTWQDVIDLIDDGNDVLICSEIQLDQNTIIQSDRAIRFVKDGAIDLNGFTLQLNVTIINPTNRWIFKNVVLDEDYPARLLGTGSTLTGNFGGDNNRYPSWWGAVPLFVVAEVIVATQAFAEQNNHAIAAAALSGTGSGQNPTQRFVVLSEGLYSIHRPIRLDGLRCTIMGANQAAMNTVQLWARSNSFVFDTSYYITTEDYPDNVGDESTKGTTPVIQIGSVIGFAVPMDEGFMSGVRNLSINCPFENLPARRVSGIMWECQLQEGSSVEFVNVQNYGGYGIGGPQWQRLSHNGAPQAFYTQLNTVSFRNLWIFQALFEDSIGMSVYGLNFSVRDITIRHEGIISSGVSKAAIYTGSRTCGTWSNLHIEQRPLPGTNGIAMHILNTGTHDNISVDGLVWYPTGSVVDPLTTFTALQIDNFRGSLSARNISNNNPYNHLGGARAIRDTWTGRESKSYHTTQGNSDHVAHYSRQTKELYPHIITSDPNLELVEEYAIDPPSLADGTEHVTGSLALPFTLLGDNLECSFNKNLQGVEVDVWVQSTNVIIARFRNDTGGVVDLPDGILKVQTRKI